MVYNILLVQDDAAAAGAISNALCGSSGGLFRVEWVRLCSAGVHRLVRSEERRGEATTGAIAAVLADLSLPDSRGIHTFERLFRVAPQVPILILSDIRDEDVAKLAVRRGAQDYLLTAHIDSHLLPKTLRSMVERAAKAEAVFAEEERAQVTLNSIGDAVMSTDINGDVTYLNLVAEGLTGWSRAEAAGHPVDEVFRIIDAVTRERVSNPMALAIRENKTVGLTPNCILVRRDGVEAAIEDSAAPIHDRRGQVTGAVMVFHDVSTARALAMKMSYLAQHDALTDLPNRIMLNDRLTQAMTLAGRHRQKLAILFLDIDHFKHINDSLGHVVGDRLLQSVAQRLLSCVRTSDTVSRQGGDEFVILLSELSHSQDAAVSAEKILSVVGAPHRIDAHDLHVTASIGISTYPDDGLEVEPLIQQADFAMYHAKEAGRNNYRFFKPDMNARALERRSVEDNLRRAMACGEFELHYQPKMNLLSASIAGAEALVRWRRPPGGLVHPRDFISIAEESGLIIPIGRWVLHEACRQARAWQDAGLSPGSIAVNISAAELRAKDFVANVRAVLAETGLAPHYLELELTETSLLQDPKSAATVLQALKGLGVRLALDDFGTGYSSLSHLRRFPMDTLKIDQSFVRDLATDSDDASIVSAVIGMGTTLHMLVVAEGIETQQQLAFLRDHACPEGQGYYFSEPVAAAEFGQLLERDGTAARTREVTI
jgi:diguanylate cyclase (GGDEF)-like protein/PAS domain S-box-containing protein